jgi:hypothetical protein
MTFVVIAAESMLVVPRRVETPPVVYLYNSTSTFIVSLAFIEKCATQAQRPEGILIMLGTPESVAKVANKVLVFPAMLVVSVTSPVIVAFGDHCL